MKLFRRKKLKGDAAKHEAAFGHLQKAHSSLMSDNADEAVQHIGRAFQTVNAGRPKPMPTNAQVKRNTATGSQKPLNAGPASDIAGVSLSGGPGRG